MKRIVFFVGISILAVITLSAQIQGSGTMADPYHGINTVNFTITGTKYFNANIGVSSGTLTVSPGAKLVSLSSSACVVISGTGQLQAAGTSSSPIVFTTDTDQDGIFGESGEYWGNILMTSSGTSNLSYCTIERGQRLGSRITALGGGLYIGAGTVTVSNSSIRNCTAYKGGAAYIASGSSPTFSRCQFTGNTANHHGGAIYISSTSAPLISNSVFRNNSSLSTTLLGGTIASIQGAPKITNSDIINSTSAATDGKSVYLENSPDAIIVNTIIWGGSNHISLSGTPSSVFNYCAIEGVSFTGCINLNSTNDAPDGPNFANPVIGKYTISFISPCRDAGIDSYAGITIPSGDYSGVGHIGVSDIGAYENIYSRWTGNTSTDWSIATNWDESYSPSTTLNIIIPADVSTFPTLSPGPSFTLSSGLKMIIEPGAQATFSSLTNNGTIDLQTDDTGIASMMTNSYSGSGGTLNTAIFITGGSAGTELYRWHYIAAPANSPTSVFTVINPYNLLSYDESKVVSDISEGWQWHDGYDGTTGFSTLEAKKGYNVFNNSDATIEFTGLTSLTTSMGQIDLPYSGTSGDTSLYGYSLIGNSLTCGMNWDLVTTSSSTYVRNAIYITTNGIVASYVNGVGTNGGTAHIPPLQGFFVKTRAPGTYITIPDNAREHNSTLRFKSTYSDIPLIRLELSDQVSKDETVIRLDEEGTLYFDNLFDAGKMFGPINSLPQIYSVLNGDVYSINTIPWPETLTTIPLTVNIPAEGTYEIKCTELQSLGDYKATLKDNTTGTVIDLSAVPVYTFTSSTGTFSGRFSVNVISSTYSVNDISGIPGLKIYSSGKTIIIETSGEEWEDTPGKVRIFDLAGRILYNGTNEWFYSGEKKEYSISNTSGLLFVEVTAGSKRFREKVVITR